MLNRINIKGMAFETLYFNNLPISSINTTHCIRPDSTLLEKICLMSYILNTVYSMLPLSTNLVRLLINI